MNVASTPVPGFGSTAIAGLGAPAAPAAPDAATPDEALAKGFAALLASALSPGRPGGAQAGGRAGKVGETDADDAPGESDAEAIAGGPLEGGLITLATPLAGLPAAPQTVGSASDQADGAPVPAGDAPDSGQPRIDVPGAPTAEAARRGTKGLDGEFAERFERVVARMSEEFGHTVEVVETHREQGRQDALFEQGRTRPGPVVTWTRHSNHTLGRAADVMIDGSFDNPEGYRRLAAVAAEEGLRTLGPRDPGHVELPAAGATRRTAGELAAQQPAHPLQVADVARVARVAEVARVAQVATVGASALRVRAIGTVSGAGPTGDAGSPPAAGDLVPTDVGEPIPSLPPELRIAIEGPGSGARAGSQDGRDRGAPFAMEPATGREEEQADVAALTGAAPLAEGSARPDSQAAGLSTAQRPSVTAQISEASGPIGVDVAGRIARALELQDTRLAQPLSHMLLRVENPGGTEDRIRVDLRGGTVGATLDIGSVADANRLTARVQELTRALERQGLEAESVLIRPTASAETAEISRVAAALAEMDALRIGATRQGSESSLSRDRGGDTAAKDQRQEKPDDSRNRSRKEPKGGKSE